MAIEDSLRSPQGQHLIAQVASAFGIDQQKAADAVGMLSAEIKRRIERAMLSRGGVADVVSLVTDPTAQSAYRNPGSLASPGTIAAGDDVLDVLIGSKHVSRGIAARTASATGLDAATVQKMLPVVANLVIGEMQRQAGPAIAKVAGSIPAFSGAGGSPLPLPGERLPRSAPEIPDETSTYQSSHGSGNGGTSGGFGNPLPLPGDNIPGIGRRNRYRDPDPDQDDDNPYSRLPDIVRRGGQRVPGNGSPGGSLEDVIRSILGNLLGSNSGVIGTMIKLFLVRWIVSFIRRVLSGGR